MKSTSRCLACDLGKLLCEARERAALSYHSVAWAIGCYVAQVPAWEDGSERIARPHLEALIGLYALDPTTTLDLWINAGIEQRQKHLLRMGHCPCAAVCLRDCPEIPGFGMLETEHDAVRCRSKREKLERPREAPHCHNGAPLTAASIA